jgi:hypothetical protein
MIMKRLVWLIFLLPVLWGRGASQETVTQDVPASRQDVERLLTLLRMRERTELIMESSRQQFKVMAAEMLRKELPDATDQERSRFEGMLDEMVDTIQKDYPVEALLQDMVPV